MARTKQAKNPWMKFYGSNWRADECLRMCSLTARGLWIEMICLMDRADPRGYLLVNGLYPTIDELAVLVGATPEVTQSAFDELDRAGVFSWATKNKTRIPYSRKMIKDQKKAKIAQQNGQNGGNPSLGNQTRNPPSDNQTTTKQDNQETQIPVGSLDKLRSQKPEDREERNIPSPPVTSSATAPGDGGGQSDLEKIGEQVCEILQVDGKTHTNWHFLGSAVDRWLRSGCTEADILAGARAVKASLDKRNEGPPGSPNYLDKAIARAKRDRESPMPTADLRRGEVPAGPTVPRQPWQEYRSELIRQKTPEADAMSARLRDAFGSGGPDGHARANALAKQFQSQPETVQ